MKTKVLLAAIPLFLTGCLKVVEGKNSYSSAEEQGLIQSKCQELNAIGNVRDLIREIKINMNQVHVDLQSEDLNTVKEDISSRGEAIHSITDRLIQALSVDYTEASSNQSLEWFLGRKTLRLFDRNVIWKASSARIESVHDWAGDVTQDLKDQFVITNEKGGFRIRLQRLASITDICQLQQTFVVILKVDYRSHFGKRSLSYRLKINNEGEK